MNKKINKFDISLILVLVAFNCFLIYINSKNIAYSDNNEALIYSDNELIGKYVLKKGYEHEFTVHSDNGYNTVKIKDNKIWIEDADCKDKYCVHQGEIGSKGQVIVCIPNKLLIKIAGNDHDIDFISH